MNKVRVSCPLPWFQLGPSYSGPRIHLRLSCSQFHPEAKGLPFYPSRGRGEGMVEEVMLQVPRRGGSDMGRNIWRVGRVG